DGRFAEASASADRAEALSAAAGDGGWLVGVHRMFAELVRTDPLSARSRELATQYAPGRAALAALVAMCDGDREACRAALAPLTAVPLDQDLASIVGVTTAFVGDRERAAAAYDALASRRGRIAL